VTTTPQNLSPAPEHDEPKQATAAIDVLFYDGVCALCNGVVRFLLARDHERAFRYAALQSDFARAALAPSGPKLDELSTVLLLQGFGTSNQRLLARSRAILAALQRLGGGWGRLARLLSFLPTVLLDSVYRLVARTRYAVFGRYDTCPLPNPEHRELFIDAASGGLRAGGEELGAAIAPDGDRTQ